VAVIDSSTAVLTWDGSLNAADILWNNTGSTFSSTDNRIFVVGIDKDDRGVGQQFGVLFRDYTYQRILGGGRVKRDCVKDNILLPVDYVKRSGCGGHVERGNNARRVVFP
jgi:hypothetical protein